MNKDKVVVNTQNIFLNKIRVDKEHVNIYLLNGTRLYGVVKGFDEYTIVLESRGSQTLIYKNSIASIAPQNAVRPIKDSANVTI